MGTICPHGLEFKGKNLCTMDLRKVYKALWTYIDWHTNVTHTHTWNCRWNYCPCVPGWATIERRAAVNLLKAFYCKTKKAQEDLEDYFHSLGFI